MTEKIKPPTLEEFKAWHGGLTKLDQMNFDTLVSLPSVMKLVCKMPEGEYRRMMIYALALKEVYRGTNAPAK